MYGVFKTTGAYRSNKVPESSWNIVNEDENIGSPIEIFDSREEAIKALYTNDSYKPDTDIVYFVAEIEIYDEDEDHNDPKNMISGDGYAIRGLYRDEYEEEYRPIAPRVVNVKFILNGDACKGVEVELPKQGNEYDGDEYYIDGATAEEVEELCTFVGNRMNVSTLRAHYDLIEDGVLGNKVVEIDMSKWRSLRKSYGLTLAKMSERTGIPMRTLQDWESERRTPPEYMFDLVENKLKNM